MQEMSGTRLPAVQHFFKLALAVKPGSNLLFIDLYSMNTILAFWIISEMIFVNLSWINKDPAPIPILQDHEGIELNINNIRNKKGLIQVCVFDSENGYPDKSQMKFTLSKDTIATGKLRVFIPVRNPGPLSITVLDDENKNEKMDFVFGIKPKEGFGFSNNPRVPGRKAPPYGDTRINYTGGMVVVVINMKYI
jgi:uncharacterized protein (DUF2141 family)